MRRVFVRHRVRGVAVNRDDEVPRRIDEDALLKDAAGTEGAAVVEPPEIAVTLIAFGRRDGFGDPALRNYSRAVAQHPVCQHEAADAGVVAQRRVHAAATRLNPTLFREQPIGIMLHAEGAPDLIL